MYAEELDSLKKMKREMYGEDRADDIPHAIAVMDLVETVSKARKFAP